MGIREPLRGDDSPAIVVEDRPGGVRVLTIFNPKKRNALDAALLRELLAALDPSRAEGVRVLLLRGEGAHFCSGYDLSGLDRIAEDGPLPDAPLQDALAALEAHPAVSVACVRGAAFGGGAELALACDLRVFSDEAVFCLPPAKIGVVYAHQGLRRLTDVVGLPRAKLLFFTGRRVAAAQALEWGLCEQVHPAADTEESALELCEEIAANAPLSIQGMKRTFQVLANGEPSAEALRELESLRRRAFGSQDAREGRAALMEKRPPRFSGK